MDLRLAAGLVVAAYLGAQTPEDRISAVGWVQSLSDPDPQTRFQAAYRAHDLETAPGAVVELVSALRNRSAFVRQHAAAALGDLGGGRGDVAEALTTLLSDSDPAVRAQAALALSKIGEPAIPLLVDMLTRSTIIDPSVRIGNKEQADLLLSDYAAVALGRLREPIFDEFLKGYLRLRERDRALVPFDENGSPPTGEPSQDKDGHVRRPITAGYVRELMLTMLEERGAIEAPAMVAYLQNDADARDADIGLLIAGAAPLSEAGVEICLDLLHRYRLPNVRKEALSRLGSISWWADLASRAREQVTDEFLALASGDDKDLRISAIKELGSMGERSLPELGWKAIKRALGDSDPEVRAAAVRSVERLHSDDSGQHSDIYLVPELERIMRLGARPEERDAAVGALRYFGDDAAGVVPVLLDELGNVGSDIHHAVVGTLGDLFKAHPPDVLTRKRLLGMLDSPDEWVRRLVIEVVTLPGEQAEGTGSALLEQLQKHSGEIAYGNSWELMEALKTRVAPDVQLITRLSAILERRQRDSRRMTWLQGEALELVSAYGEKSDAAAPAVGTWLGTAEESQALAALAKMGSRARQVLRARIDDLPRVRRPESAN